MVLKKKVLTCEHCDLKKKKKKKDFPNFLDIEVIGPDLWRQFRKIKIFFFMILKAQVRKCEHRSHEKKKKRFTQPPRHRSHKSGT